MQDIYNRKRFANFNFGEFSVLPPEGDFNFGEFTVQPPDGIFKFDEVINTRQCSEYKFGEVNLVINSTNLNAMNLPN
jgi:hypothetical protein